jgi:hypothetical protein
MWTLRLLVCFTLSSFADSPNAKFESILTSRVQSRTTPRGYKLPWHQETLDDLTKELWAVASGYQHPLPSKVAGSLKSLGYATEIKTVGECGPSQQTCRALVIGRRTVSVTNGDLKSVIGTYTSDLRFPNDKSLNVHGIQIQRHHWELDKTKAVKINSPTLSQPMQAGREYRLKKCRDGHFMSWKCNTIAYELFDFGNSASLLTGRLAATDQEPVSFTLQDCPTCTQSFLAPQRQNTSSGTLSLTLFKSVEGPRKSILIYEITVGAVEDPTEAKRLLAAEEYLIEGLAIEYRALAGKLPNHFVGNLEMLTAPSSVTIASVEENDLAERLKKERNFGLLMGCCLALISTFFSIYRFNIDKSWS